MFYVVTYAGSGLATVGVGLLATHLGLVRSVQAFAALFAAGGLAVLAALRGSGPVGRVPDTP
jgi:hypothetical protein